VVAVSGGADSTALLVVMASLAREFGLVLHAAHLHHGLRGADADEDAQSVRELCERFQIPLAAARWDCATRMRRRGLSGEAGLRTLRREWLAGVARRVGATGIATAHTADDQLETLLMRLARGTGLSGAAGMRARRGPWLKPCLLATRALVEAELRTHRITWREDQSNAEPTWLRNRIRHLAVPALLDALGVPAGASAVRRAGLARRAAALTTELAAIDRLLERSASRALRRVTSEVRAGATLDARAIAGLPGVLQRRMLRRAWRLRRGESGPGLTARHLDAGLTVIATAARTGARPASATLPGGWRLSTSRGMVHFAPPEPAEPRPARGAGRVGPHDARLQGSHRRVRRGLSGEPPVRRRGSRVGVQ
jgi:tRNA(Ile)-lysidine synthase